MLDSAVHPVPIDAQCLGCAYHLRGLTVYRCPECGRAFDPSDPQTMYLGRRQSAWARAFILPIGREINLCLIIECFGLFWVAASLPLAPIIAALVFTTLPLTLSYIFIRRLIRRGLMARHRRAVKSLPPPCRWPRSVSVTFVILSLVSALVHPARIPFLLSRPIIEAQCRHLYNDIPLLAGNERTGFYGLFWITKVRVEPRGVQLYTWDGRCIWYNDRDGLYLRDAVPPSVIAVAIVEAATGIDARDGVMFKLVRWLDPDGYF